jgi:hypothetical protein
MTINRVNNLSEYKTSPFDSYRNSNYSNPEFLTMRASKLNITISSLLGLIFSPSSRGSSGTSTCGTLLSAYNASITYLGCYTDGNVRTLQGLSSAPDSLNSPQYCANLCGGLGYKYSGVETA